MRMKAAMTVPAARAIWRVAEGGGESGRTALAAMFMIIIVMRGWDVTFAILDRYGIIPAHSFSSIRSFP